VTLVLAACSPSGAPPAAEKTAAAGGEAGALGSRRATEWGDPIIQGMCRSSNLISTPLQRPLNKDGTPSTAIDGSLNDEEYAKTQANLAARDKRYEDEIKSNKMGMATGPRASHHNEAARLTSLLYEPANGRFPELTERRQGAGVEDEQLVGAPRYSRSPPTSTPGIAASHVACRRRCSPSNYNTAVEIMQTPATSSCVCEMVHETRVIPIDGPAGARSAIKQWW